ncbi:MAG: hypothetical protein WCS42_08610 [Verrucomicrobiota bacterium]
MDLLEGTGNDITQVAEQSRHGGTGRIAVTGVGRAARIIPSPTPAPVTSNAQTRSTPSTSGASATPTATPRNASTLFDGHRKLAPIGYGLLSE